MVFDDVPNKLTNFFSAKFVKNTIAAKYYEIDFLTAVFEIKDIWVTNDDTWHASQVRIFSFDITKSSRNRKSAWGDSVRSHKRVVCILVGCSYKLINSYLLYHRSGIVSFEDSLRLIDPSTVCIYSFIFAWVHRFVVVSKRLILLSKISAHDCSAISNVYTVEILINCHNHESTRPSTVNGRHLLFGLCKLLFIFIVQHG